jgi:hypothetical protein
VIGESIPPQVSGDSIATDGTLVPDLAGSDWDAAFEQLVASIGTPQLISRATLAARRQWCLRGHCLYPNKTVMFSKTQHRATIQSLRCTANPVLQMSSSAAFAAGSRYSTFEVVFASGASTSTVQVAFIHSVIRDEDRRVCKGERRTPYQTRQDSPANGWMAITLEITMMQCETPIIDDAQRKNS